jgi:RNA polymerase sigma factor (sigma-70 family)
MRVYANQMRSRNDDATLVRRLQSGDERAFETIFKRYRAPLLSYCRHTLSSQDEAEDALQQAFIKAHQALLGGTAPRELRPWLYAIARNCCLTAISARRGRVGIESLQDPTPALAGLSEVVRQREDLRELVAGIGRLPEDQRSALLLAELDDLPHQAIATIVGCEVSKVKALIYQARSALIADRDAQNTSCQDIREQLAVAHGGELRRGPLRRHLKLCVGCRDFQLAVGAQRQSLGVVLPVAPSAGLAAAILGHGAAHVAGAASVGHATGAAGLAPSAGVGGAGVGAGGTSVAAGTGVGAGAAGGGVAVSGGAAATTAAGASAGGTSVGALIGGGLVTKLAVGGAVVAIAAAGAVTVHNHEASAAARRPIHARLVAAAAATAKQGETTDIADASPAPSDPLAPGSSTAPALGSETAPAGSLGSDPLPPATELTGLGGANPLLSASGTLAPSGAAPSAPGQPAGAPVQGNGGKVATNPDARAKLRAALHRRRELLRRRALLRRLRAARRRARRKALRHKHPAVKPVEPPVTPAPVLVPHRKGDSAPSSGAAGQPGTSAKEIREAQEAKAKKAREAKEAREAKKATEAKEAEEAQEAKEAREKKAKEAKEAREAKEAKEKKAREAREAKEAKEALETGKSGSKAAAGKTGAGSGSGKTEEQLPNL